MKKIYLAILTCIALCSSLILLVDQDEKQRQDFLILELGSINETIQIEGYEIIPFDQEFDGLIEKLSNQYNARVMIPFFGVEDKALKVLYTDNVHPILTSVLNVDASEKGLYQTYGENANIKDILNNDYFIYESLLKREDSSLFWDGKFYLGAESTDDIESFITAFSNYYGIDHESVRMTSRQYRNTSTSTKVFLITTLFIFLILYFLAILQKVVSNSKKIGVLFLLGYSSWKTVKKVFSNEYKVLFLSGLLSIMSFFILPNIPQRLLLIVLFKDIVLLMMTYLLCVFAVKIIRHKQNPAEILKRKNVAQKLTKLNIVVQILVCTTVLLIALLSSRNFIEVFDNKKIEDEAKSILNYGVIYYVDVDSVNQNFRLNNEFYNKVISDDLLKDRYIYAMFGWYSVYRDDAIVMEGYQYDDLYAIVSSNYFDNEGIIVFDDEGNEVKLKEYNEEDIFIFPYEYSSDPTIVFDNYYNFKYENYKGNYEEYNPKILYYENQMLPTYELEVIRVDSPVLKLVRNDNEISYIDDPIGLSLYGIRLSTALKFRIDEDKEKVVERVSEILRESGYPEFNSNHFVMVKEYLSEEIYRNYQAIRLLGLFMMLIGVLIVFAQAQFILLYLIQNNREISVKQYLGHGPISTFGDIVVTNLMVACVSITLGAILNVFLKIGDWVIYIGFSFLFLLFILGTTSCIVFFQQRNIARMLKERGG